MRYCCIFILLFLVVNGGVRQARGAVDPHQDVMFLACKNAVQPTSVPQEFSRSDCYRFLYGFYSGMSHGSMFVLSYLSPKIDQIEESGWLVDFSKKFPICTPGDFKNVGPDFGFKDVAKAYVRYVEGSNSDAREKMAGAIFFDFLIKTGKCENIRR